MKIVEVLKRVIGNSDKSVELRALNNKLDQLIVGSDNQQRLLAEKLDQLVAGSGNEQRLLSEKLKELIEGVVNQSRLLNDKLLAITSRQEAQMELQKAAIVSIRDGRSGRAGANDDLSTIHVRPVSGTPIESESFQRAMAALPLMIDAKTYNTSHPDYDARLVRNFPGKILNADKPCDNIVYGSLRRLARSDELEASVWNQILKDALEEAKTVPHSDQVFERRDFIENYLVELTKKYGAHYAAGWVNLDDALFLYWLVRKLNPKTIVQTGVCNGLSSAFMMLGLVKNGSEGRLRVIDLPPVFNATDAAWTTRGKVYGVVIPEGKSSGWMVPDAYRDRFEVWTGDAKVLLPKMVDDVDSIDLFYHDSDHTYGHMMFEFREAKRKLRSGGLIVGDDVSWNASVWDFADQYGVPSYNFKGAVGVAFF